MTVDRAGLKSWYRQAMVRRIDELRALRGRLRLADQAACDAARAIGQALRGSGATFGFPGLTEVAALVESASNAVVLRRIEGLIEHLHGLGRESGAPPQVHAEWLTRAAGEERSGLPTFADIESAWHHISQERALGQHGLAERAAEFLGVGVADLSQPNRAPLRLVPEALMWSEWVLPVGEDSETITVASADPTDLDTELELTRVTGRHPMFKVSPPDALKHALTALLESSVRDVRLRGRTSVAGDGGVERVLVVDDETSGRVLAKVILEKRGYQVVEAGDGLEAIERLRLQQPIGLVVADLNMPRMDGLELLWEMRDSAEWAHIPIIVLTGATDEILETKLIEEGADDYICKPIDPRLFLARVHATMRRGED